jgi:hypothetical protein
MAKKKRAKARASPAARKTSKTRSARRKRRASSPKRRKTVTVAVQSVVQFVKMLFDRGQADDFIAAAKEAKASVTVRADSVEFIRKYIADNRLRGAMAASVVDPCPDDPFECREILGL